VYEKRVGINEIWSWICVIFFVAYNCGVRLLSWVLWCKILLSCFLLKEVWDSSTINALQNFLHFPPATFTVDWNFQEPCLGQETKRVKWLVLEDQRGQIWRRKKWDYACSNYCESFDWGKVVGSSSSTW